jgi:hypothetical protein
LIEGRAAIGYDHSYDAQKFYLGLALDPSYVEGFVEGTWSGSVKKTHIGRRSCGICGRRGDGDGARSGYEQGGGQGVRPPE